MSGQEQNKFDLNGCEVGKSRKSLTLQGGQELVAYTLNNFEKP